MCTKPQWITVEKGPNTVPQKVACNTCWSCYYKRENDFVGRCLAEQWDSPNVTQLTLTYRTQDDFAHKVLQPHHFQNFIKKLRSDGHKIRYLVCGEYGKLRSRAHFHCILYGQANPEGKHNPFQIPHKKKKITFKHWEYGYTFADNDGSERAARYVCKYLLKEQREKPKETKKRSAQSLDRQIWFSMSKKPPLGANFFDTKAKRDAGYNVFPQTFEYMPSGGKKGRSYTMSGATRRNYLYTLLKHARRQPTEDELQEWIWSAKGSMERWDFIRNLDDAWHILDFENMKDEINRFRSTVAEVEKNMKRELDESIYSNFLFQEALNGDTQAQELQAERLERREFKKHWLKVRGH